MTEIDWRDKARCAARDANGANIHDPELFFPVGNSGPALLQIAEAKAVCHACPVASMCLSWALESGQDAGVWGGMSEDERRSLKRRDHARATRSSTSGTPRPPRHHDEVAVARLVNGERTVTTNDERHAAIRLMARQGHGHCAIATRLGMNATTVRGIIESFEPDENQGVA